MYRVEEGKQNRAMKLRRMWAAQRAIKLRESTWSLGMREESDLATQPAMHRNFASFYPTVTSETAISARLIDWVVLMQFEMLGVGRAADARLELPDGALHIS